MPLDTPHEPATHNTTDMYRVHKPVFVIELGRPNSPCAIPRLLPVPQPRRLPCVGVSLFWEGDRGYVYEEESTYSLFSPLRPMRTAMTSARARFEWVGWMKIPSGFDFERGLVVTGRACSEAAGGVYWNEGDICDGEMGYGYEFAWEAGRDICVCCDDL